EVPVDDALAQAMGAENLDALRDRVREQLENEYKTLARMRMKRDLLDALAERHIFPVPAGMVDSEFEEIWQQVEADRQADRLEPGDKAKLRGDLKREYRQIAERRVRLGLLLSEVGRRNNIQVTAEELNRAILQEARRYPGQERQVLEFYQKSP